LGFAQAARRHVSGKPDTLLGGRHGLSSNNVSIGAAGDLVLTTGGASAGERDHVKRAAERQDSA